jgi:glutathione S-transferase
MYRGLYTAGTPNGQKISITLEELGLSYDVTHVDIAKNIQKEEWYLKINRSTLVPTFVSGTNELTHDFLSQWTYSLDH